MKAVMALRAGTGISMGDPLSMGVSVVLVQVTLTVFKLDVYSNFISPFLPNPSLLYIAYDPVNASNPLHHP